MSQFALQPSNHNAPPWVAAVGFITATFVGLVIAAASNFVQQPAIVVSHANRIVVVSQPSSLDQGEAQSPQDEVRGISISVPPVVRAQVPAGPVTPANDAVSDVHVELYQDSEIATPTEIEAPRQLADVWTAPVAPVVENPAPVQIEVAVIADVPAAAPVQIEASPAVPTPASIQVAVLAEVPVAAPVQIEASPPVPAPAPVRAVAPAVGRAGPAGVVNQIPASAYAWTDANGWSIEWRQGPGPGRIAEAQYATSTIVIWYDTNRSDATWAGAFAHELGHAVSFRHFSSQQMDEWNTMRGLASWRWVPGTSNDFSVGEGDFAEAFMNYLLGHPVRSAGGPLTQQQRAWIAANTPF